MGLVGKGYNYLDQSSECNYLTHIVFRLFEHLDKAPNDTMKYRVELLLSPGVTTDLNMIGILYSSPYPPIQYFSGKKRR
jgi:hypothetical protein